MSKEKIKKMVSKIGEKGKETHSWLDKHVEKQKKSQGKFHNVINYGSHKSEKEEYTPPKGKTRSFKNRENALHSYLTSGK
jgi:hypothetical protein